jgi:exonuclease SbcD
VGNHDVSPAVGRAHAIHEFDTLQVPLVRVISAPCFLRPPDLWDLPLQVIAWPWVSRSGIMASRELSGTDSAELHSQMIEIIIEKTNEWLGQAEPSLPMVLTAHASVEGAVYGSERMVMLGSDLVLPGSLVRDRRLDYVALGHIHKPQDLNRGSQPPIIYPGSIERVDFGEAADDRFYVLAHVDRGNTRVEWKKLTQARRFIERRTTLQPARAAAEASAENVTEDLKAALPSQQDLEGAIVKLTVDYPREYDALIDEPALRKYAEQAFEFHLVRRPRTASRVRLPADQTVSGLSPLELLEQYWRAASIEPAEIEALKKLAREIIAAEDDIGDGT